LHDIDFSLDPGKCLGIAGESGSGKSLTALSIMGLLPEDAIIESGEINYSVGEGDHRDLIRIRDSEYRKIRGNEISMIFQEPMSSLNPVMTCGMQVREVLQLHSKMSSREAKRRVIELFSEVQLPRPDHIYRCFPHEISGGQKQRVMIAMAMACNPKILIADEPTTALDVTVQKSILGLIKKLSADHNTAVIFISHDLGVLNEIADDIIIMHRGRIVERGEKSMIFHNPKHTYTRGLLACRPQLKLMLKRLPTMNDFRNPEVGTTEILNSLLIENIPGDVQGNKAGNTDSHPVIELKQVKTHFKSRKRIFKMNPEAIRAVDGISYKVFPGETIGLVGESGCGKTTLGRTILRLVDSTSGSIYFKGADITNIPSTNKQFRRSIQIIFQDPYASLNPRLTVGSAITEPMRVHRLVKKPSLRRERAKDLLEKVGLDMEYYQRYPHELSGGQRQRVVIARALAMSPEFIICDESVSALDVSIQALVLNLLNDLKQEYGFTFIFISHDLAVVKHMSDRIIVMKDGYIIESGDADILYLNPEHEYTRQLIGAIPEVN